jgi:hypothetical protein
MNRAGPEQTETEGKYFSCDIAPGSDPETEWEAPGFIGKTQADKAVHIRI